MKHLYQNSKSPDLIKGIFIKLKKITMNRLPLFIILLLGFNNVNGQTYCFTAPQGYGAGTTGGGNATPVTVTTQAALQAALVASGPAVILVSGTITCPYTTVLANDKTILGLPGARLVNLDQTATGSGILNLKPGSSNVIMRNLIFESAGAYDTDGRDNFCISGGINVWVDHCEFQDGVDGNFDTKALSDNITVSWCKFTYLKAPKSGGSGGTADHRFSDLVGSSDSDKPSDGKFSMTWQYCWWASGCVERMVRARNAQLDMVNCYWNSQQTKVALGLGGVTDCYVQNSVFANSGNKYSYYDNGTVRLTTSGCTAPPANVGTCPVPAYTRELTSVSSLVSVITGPCGAGATLNITPAGYISANSACAPVNKVPTASITAPANSSSSCQGVAITLTATATDTDGSITKVDFYDGTALLGTATTSPYTYSWTTAASGSHSITAKATDNAGTSGTSTAVNITVNAAPSAPTVTSPVTYCQNATATALTATGNSLKWYTVPTSGTSSTTAPTPITTATGTTSYYVSQTTSGCESVRAAIAVTINATPSAPTVTSPVTYCQNATATALTATGTALKWYTVPTSGTSSTTAPTPITTAIGTTSYYVSQTTGTCESARATIAVTISAAPSAPTVTSPVTYCQNATATALTATGTALKWYTVPTSGTSSTTEPTPITTAIGTTSYYVSQTTGTCESARATIAVTINAAPSAPTVTSPVTYCQNATATALTATGTALNWYTVSSSGTSSTTAPTPITTAIGTTSYYVSQTMGTCESARATIAVTINAAPSVPTVTSPVTYCQNATATALTATGTALKWYTVPSSGTSSNIAPTPITTTIGTTSYYVSQTISSCESPRATIAVTINALPSATITAGGPTTFIQGGSVLLSANTGTGFTYKWLNGPAQVGTASTYSATTGGDYTVEVTNASGCKTISSVITVSVNGNQLPAVNIIAPANNATFMEPAAITISATASDADGTIAKVDFYYGNTLIGSDNTAPYSFPWANAMAGTYSLKAVATDNLGGSATSAVINVTVTPANQAPTVSITSPLNNASFTAVANITITATAADADGTVLKVDFYNGTTLLATDPTSPYSFAFNNLLAGAYTLTAKATDNSGAVATSSIVNVTVSANQPSVINIISPVNNSIVTGTSVTINVDATDPDGSITKVEYLDGNTVIGTSTTQPYTYTWSNPTAGAHVITVRVTDSNGGVTTSSSTTITVGTGTGIISSSYGAFTQVYPNPSLEAFTIKASQGIKNLSVVNMYGVELITLQDLSADQQIEIGKDLADGTYVLLIKYASDKMEVAKLVKIK